MADLYEEIVKLKAEGGSAAPTDVRLLGRPG